MKNNMPTNVKASYDRIKTLVSIVVGGRMKITQRATLGANLLVKAPEKLGKHARPKVFKKLYWDNFGNNFWKGLKPCKVRIGRR